MENTGFISSLFLFIWLPCIPTLLVIAFGKAFTDMGMSTFLLGLFWMTSTILLAIYKYQELENVVKQFKKGNWF